MCFTDNHCTQRIVGAPGVQRAPAGCWRTLYGILNILLSLLPTRWFFSVGNKTHWLMGKTFHRWFAAEFCSLTVSEFSLCFKSFAERPLRLITVSHCLIAENCVCVYSEIILIREEPRGFSQCDPRQEDVLLHAAVHTESEWWHIPFHSLLLYVAHILRVIWCRFTSLGWVKTWVWLNKLKFVHLHIRTNFCVDFWWDRHTPWSAGWESCSTLTHLCGVPPHDNPPAFQVRSFLLKLSTKSDAHIQPGQRL